MGSQDVGFLYATILQDDSTVKINFPLDKPLYLTKKMRKEIKSKLGVSSKVQFYCGGQRVWPKINLLSLKAGELTDIDKGYILENNFPVTSKGSEMNTPFDFVLIKDGNVFDRLFMESATNKTTVRDVTNWLSSQSSSSWDTCSFYFDGYGKTRELLRNERYPKSSRLMNIPIFDFLCTENSIPVRVKDYGLNLKNTSKNKNSIVLHISQGAKTVLIKTLRGEQVELTVNNRLSILHFKKMISESVDLPVREMRVIFAGKQLEDYRTIGDYDIQHNSTVHLVLKLAGGGQIINFVDVTSGKLKQTDWSEDAPKWCCVGKGLVISGVCENNICEAYEQTVYCTIGLKNFDLIVEKNKCLCPQCGVKFVPKCPGFNNCYWKVKSVKQDSQETVSTRWSQAGDAFTTFDEHASGTATFERIQFFIRPNEIDQQVPKPSTCGICFQALDTHLKTLNCQHSFHRHCLKSPAVCIICS